MRSDLQPWQHPNILTWVRCTAGNGVVATVSMTGANPDAFATVLVSGQQTRRNFTTVDLAKAWCDELLEADGPPPPKHKKRASPAAPEEPPVERLLRFLRNDPDLAWLVANRAKALGPWVSVGDDWRERSDGTGFVVATVRFQEHGWVWTEFIPTSDGPGAIAEQDRIASDEEAKDVCDEHLRSKGWLLATKPLENA